MSMVVALAFSILIFWCESFSCHAYSEEMAEEKKQTRIFEMDHCIGANNIVHNRDPSGTSSWVEGRFRCHCYPACLINYCPSKTDPRQGHSIKKCTLQGCLNEGKFLHFGESFVNKVGQSCFCKKGQAPGRILNCGDFCPSQHISCSVDKCLYYEQGPGMEGPREGLVNRGEEVLTKEGKRCKCGERFPGSYSREFMPLDLNNKIYLPFYCA